VPKRAIMLPRNDQIGSDQFSILIRGEVRNWMPDAIMRDRLRYILTGVDAIQSGHWPLRDCEPCPLETTVPGILAAGDIRSGSTKRVGFAVGDGSLAVTCVHKLTSIGA
jgi:thioredoxin reductase (NADPH)